MNQVTYKTTEDYLLHGALILMAGLLKVITDDENGEKIYNNNLETMSNAVEFLEKHIEKYPSLTGGDDE
jgi:hypothetical protein